MRLGFEAYTDLLKTGVVAGIEDWSVGADGVPVRMGHFVFIERSITGVSPDDTFVGPPPEGVQTIEYRKSSVMHARSITSGYAIPPGTSVLVRTGLRLELPKEYYAEFVALPSLSLSGLSYTGSSRCENDMSGNEVLLSFLNTHKWYKLMVNPGQLVGHLAIHKYF